MQQGHAEIVHLLIDKGADVNQTDKGGSTDLYWDAQNNSLEISLNYRESLLIVNIKKFIISMR